MMSNAHTVIFFVHTCRPILKVRNGVQRPWFTLAYRPP